MLASPVQRPHQHRYHSEKKHPLSTSGSRHGRQTGLRSRTTQLLAIRFGWVVLVVWFEVGEFFSSLSSCKFPDAKLKQRVTTLPPPVPTHVVLIADPHVPHYRLSYASDSNRWVNVLRQAFDELFMRKSWNIVMRLGRIDSVIMLGDMLDWGRGVMSEEEYESYHALFRSIFSLPSSIPVHFVPGNHDIPLGPHRLFSPNSRERYERYFSNTNLVLPIANHSLVLLDSIGLVEEDYRRYAAEMQFGEWDGAEGGVIEFVKSVSEDLSNTPRILISHIPLARPEGAKCGDLRERGKISKGAGAGYQNLLGSETTEFLLEELQPLVVFSADDHDYCEYNHPGHIREVTVKSFSSSSGIRRPGLQLLSLVPPTSDSASANFREITYADRPCFLPDQVGVYNRVYFPLVLLTAMYILGTNIRQAWSRWSSGPTEKPGSWTEKNRSNPSFDRASPTGLSSRRSSQHLSASASASASGLGRTHPYGQGTSTARPSRLNTADSSFEYFPHSAPVSPHLSPVSSMTSMHEEYTRGRRHAKEDHEVALESPASSRRSSYVNLDDALSPYGTPHSSRIGSEPSVEFTPRGLTRSMSHNVHNGLEGLPRHGGIGLGISSPPLGSSYPSSPNTLRASSPNLSISSSHSHSPSPTHPSFPSRRVTMPRSQTYSPINAVHRDRYQAGVTAGNGYKSETDDHRGRGGILKTGAKSGWEGARGFVRWMWKARNNVLVRSAWEVWSVFWVVGVAWSMVNGLFFLG